MRTVGQGYSNRHHVALGGVAQAVTPVLSCVFLCVLVCVSPVDNRRGPSRSDNAGSRRRGGGDVPCRPSLHLSDRRGVLPYPADVSNGGERGEEEEVEGEGGIGRRKGGRKGGRDWGGGGKGGGIGRRDGK